MSGNLASGKGFAFLGNLASGKEVPRPHSVLHILRCVSRGNRFQP